MAFKLADRVKQTATTTGTGNFTLSATPTGYRAFSSVLSTNDTTYYTIAHQTANEWEVGYGTYSAANTLARTKVISSSNSNNAVNFTAGTKDVFITNPAMGANSNIAIGTAITYFQNAYSQGVVIGEGALSSGSNNVVIGYSAYTSSATDSVALGHNSSVYSGTQSVSIGKNTTSRNYATAVGAYTSATSDYGIAIGFLAGIGAAYNVTIGSNSAATSNNSVAVGGGSQARDYSASGTTNIALGYSSDARDGSIVIGESSIGNSQTIIGNGLTPASTTTNATFMNQFRVNPTTDLIGPAYTLTYDSTTHEVYAVTGSGPTPGGLNWITILVTGEFTDPPGMSIDAPATYTGGSGYVAGTAAFVNTGFSYYWPFNSTYDSGWYGEAAYIWGWDWGSAPSPVPYTSSTPSMGMAFMYATNPSVDGFTSVEEWDGSPNYWFYNYNNLYYLPSGAPSGVSQKVQGFFVINSGGTDLTSVITSNPAYSSIASVIKYDSYALSTLVAFEITDPAESNSALATGPVLFDFGGGSYEIRGFVWYLYS